MWTVQVHERRATTPSAKRGRGMTAFVVVNPRAGDGRTGRQWPKIRAELQSGFPLMTVAISRERGHTARLVREALRDGHLNIVAVGGGGTANEALNGFFE